MYDTKKATGRVSTLGDQILDYKATGKVDLTIDKSEITLNKVLYVPQANGNLVSEGRLVDDGTDVHWLQGRKTVFNLPQGGGITFTRPTEESRLHFAATSSTHDEVKEEIMVATDSNTVHEALGHPGPAQERKTLQALMPEAIEGHSATCDCEPCAMSKLTKARLPRHTSYEKSPRPLHRLHIDILSQFAGHSAYQYALVIVDDYSSYVNVTPLKNKGHAAQALTEFVTLAERQTNSTVQIIRSDNDMVFKSNAILDWKARMGIIWELTTPYDSRGNGKAERMIRTLRERMQAALIGKNAPYSLWPEALEYVTFTHNLTVRDGGTIPYQVFWDRTDAPRLARLLHPFACLATCFVPEKKRVGGKGGPRGIPAIFLGISMEHKGMKFYSPHASPSTFWSNSAKFYDDKEWRHRRDVANWRDLVDNRVLFADKGEDVVDLTYSVIDIIAERDREAIEHYHSELQQDLEHEGDITFDNEEQITTYDEEDDELSQEVTQEWVSLAQAHDPNSPTVQQALKGPNAPLWHEAIRREIEGLEAMGTWTLVDPPPGKRLVDSKLVLKIKTSPDGTPLKYKARLVARGFTQQEGIDFEETFAPVTPYTALRSVLAIAVAERWHVHTTDFTQAYLNGELSHDIYMKPPAGAQTDGKVYKIEKGLYGLKQSGRLWNQQLDTALRQEGFIPLSAAPCIYMKGPSERRIVVACYVDDCLWASNSLPDLELAKAALLKRFKLEDKGHITSFCGINIEYDRTAGTLNMSQHGYISAIIKEFTPEGGHAKTPMQVTPPHTDLDKDVQKVYRRAVGKLTWVANNSRPDISFAVGILQRHMSSCSQIHLDAALRVIKYLAKTIDWVIIYRPQLDDGIVAYTDANWSSDPHSKRKSTSGSVAFVFGCPVTWKTQVQKCVSLSAVEAELVAGSEAAREVLFLRNLLRELGYHPKPTVFTDSMGCIQVAKDPAQHWRLKHIDTRYFFLRDLVQTNTIEVKHVPTSMNPADLFTKPCGNHIQSRLVPLLSLTQK